MSGSSREAHPEEEGPRVNNIVEAPCYTLQHICELIVSKYVAELINN